MNPWEVARDFQNVYRRAFLLSVIENKTDAQRIEEYLKNGLREFLAELTDAHGSLLANIQVRRKDRKKHWLYKAKNKNEHKYQVRDPKTGKMITVETY